MASINVCLSDSESEDELPLNLILSENRLVEIFNEDTDESDFEFEGFSGSDSEGEIGHGDCEFDSDDDLPLMNVRRSSLRDRSAQLDDETSRSERHLYVTLY
jgi:hypothetical protein